MTLPVPALAPGLAPVAAPALVDGVLVWPAADGVAATTAAVVATEEPAPVPGEEEAIGYNSPGVVGFLVTFALVVACIPLLMSMVRKVRGVQHEPPDGAAGGPAGAPRATDPADPGDPGGDGPAPTR